MSGMRGLVASATITIEAPVSDVWKALTDPSLIRQYLFGTTVVSDWREGAPITWKGEWQGKAYEDKGVILKLEPERIIRYTHYSPLSGQPDTPDNYHTVTVELRADGLRTHVLLSQDGNATEEERDHSRQNWLIMLDSLKRLLEA